MKGTLRGTPSAQYLHCEPTLAPPEGDWVVASFTMYPAEFPASPVFGTGSSRQEFTPFEIRVVRQGDAFHFITQGRLGGNRWLADDSYFDFSKLPALTLDPATRTFTITAKKLIPNPVSDLKKVTLSGTLSCGPAS